MICLCEFKDIGIRLSVVRAETKTGSPVYHVKEQAGFILQERKTYDSANEWMHRTGIPQTRLVDSYYERIEEVPKQPFRICVCGGRDFDDYPLLSKTLKSLTKKLKKFTIVVGGAEGADKLAQDWAFHNMKPYLIYHADFKKNGVKAGPIRNRQMAKNSDAVVAFWDGKSRGTRDMIELAKKKNLKLRIIRY